MKWTACCTVTRLAHVAVRVQLDVGSKKTFASAVDWPGWSRAAGSEDEALEVLLSYGARYKRAMGAAAKGLTVPKTIRGLDVVSKVKGDSGTDYGVPSKPLVGDGDSLSPAELRRLVALVKASWRAFDRTARKAHGATLAKGPRGGGRTLAKIVDHELESCRGYLKVIGGDAPADCDATTLRAEIVDAIEARAHGELPDKGPRGGKRWSAQYAAHRIAWHALDHAWEIEDRA
jgi:hypothetical protein